MLDAKEAAVDSVAQAKASALEQVETTKANAVGAVLKPIKKQKAALPPEVQSVLSREGRPAKEGARERAGPGGTGRAGPRRTGRAGGSSFCGYQGDVPDRR